MHLKLRTVRNDESPGVLDGDFSKCVEHDGALYRALKFAFGMTSRCEP